jgi:hypothetical protein
MHHAPRRVAACLLAAAVAAATGLPATLAQVPTPPRLLAGVLRARTDMRLLDPTTDLVGDYTVAQLEELDRWPPWIEGDFDRDGRDDIAAVVVRPGGAGAPEFTVIAVHGASPARAELVAPFSPQRIFGVSEAIEEDTIKPLRCVECDANEWYRWNGRNYEAYLHAVGESIRIGLEAGRRLTLFTDPRADAARTADIPACVRAEVLEVGGEEGRRWYRVEVEAPSSLRGWVPQQLVMDDVVCDG